MQDNFLFETFPKGIIYVFSYIVIFTFQQAIVARIAFKKGDYSFETKSMMSLNPINHISLFGTIILPFFSVFFDQIIINSFGGNLHLPIILGWPKYFQPNIRHFKNPKKDLNIILLTSMFSYFIISVVAVILIKSISLISNESLILNINQSNMNYVSILITLIFTIGWVGIIFFAIDILPIPGSHCYDLIQNKVSYNTAGKMENLKNYGLIIFLLLVMTKVLNLYLSIFAIPYIYLIYG